MIDLRTLETFYVVAQVGGFHRAAEKLHTTQPAVSARIIQLEHALKAKLFDRDNRGSHLTAKGRELMVYAERMMNLRTEMLLAMSGPSALGGTVQLGVSETIVHTWLSELLKRLHNEYPTVTLEINVDTSSNLASALENGSIDVALLLGPVTSAKAQNLPLCSYPICWVAHSDLDLGDDPVSLESLAAYPILTYARSSRPYWQLADLFQKAHLKGVRFFANSSLSSIVRMTRDGIGIAAIPAETVADQIASGELRLIETGDDMPTMSFTASYFVQPDRPLNAVLAELAQEVAMQSPNC